MMKVLCFIAIPLHDNPAAAASAETGELTSDLAYTCAAPMSNSPKAQVVHELSAELQRVSEQGPYMRTVR
jgi:hypothetical protein